MAARVTNARQRGLVVGKPKVSVGVLVDTGLTKVDSIFIPIFSEEDMFLIQFAQKFIAERCPLDHTIRTFAVEFSIEHWTPEGE